MKTYTFLVIVNDSLRRYTHDMPGREPPVGWVRVPFDKRPKHYLYAWWVWEPC